MAAEETVLFVDQDAAEIGTILDRLLHAFIQFLVLVHLAPLPFNRKCFFPREWLTPHSIGAFVVQHLIQTIKQ